MNPAPNNKISSTQECFDTYTPREFAKTVTGNPILLETYGDELAFVEALHASTPQHVWTLLDGDDGELYVCAGFHFVNRVNYLITDRPWVTGTESFPWAD
jgi:hypothetical protein